jgi:hypothetical protein
METNTNNNYIGNPAHLNRIEILRQYYMSNTAMAPPVIVSLPILNGHSSKMHGEMDPTSPRKIGKS